MNVAQPTRSARIRASLDHPVIDVDGHVIEFLPALMDTLKEVAGPGMVKRYRALFEEEGDPISAGRSWYQLTPEERFDEHTVRPPVVDVPHEKHPRPGHRHAPAVAPGTPR